MKNLFLACAFALGVVACDPSQLKQGESILATVVTAAEAPACAMLNAKVPAIGVAAPTLCINAAGEAISIVDYLAQHSIKAHLKGSRLYFDGRK